MMGALSRIILKLIGWKNTGTAPKEDKFVVIVIPHTSAWDFPIGLLVRSAIEKDVKFVGKKELFRFPIAGFLKWLGGYPVDRSKNTNFIDAVVDVYNRKEKFSVCITPEGTRKKVTVLKRGFYFIAKGANVPIVMVKFDFKNKEANWHPSFYVSDDYDVDMQKVYDHFRGVQGAIPENSFDSPYIPKAERTK